MQISLTAAHDHIIGLTKYRSPIVPVEELIWNSLDADAGNVRVDVFLNDMGGLQRITIKDDGHGIPASECAAAFGSIGGSPKLKMFTTPKGRRPHGKMGRGRLKAFGLGRTVRWESRYKSDGKLLGCTISGYKATINKFDVSEPIELDSGSPGVTVEISDCDSTPTTLTDPYVAAKELSHRLALYLNQYPGIRIDYDGVMVDASMGQNHVAEYAIKVKTPDEEYDATVTVIEWDHSTNRAIYLCDTRGFARDDRPPGIQAKGWDFTAYVKSDLVEKLDDEGSLALDELHPGMKAILDATKEVLKTHFRKREANRASDLVRQWKEEQVYPYEGAPADPIKAAEREVFDVCAVTVHEHLPGFENADRKNKLLTFKLLKQSLEASPTALQTILREVLSLSAEKQEEFAKLLEKTKLASLINAGRVVMDRLNVLASLRDFLFGELHKDVNEPRQLHPIVAQELWVFGEQYLSGIDEESLTSLLKAHLSILGRTDLIQNVTHVTDLDGHDRYLDLMIHRRYVGSRKGEFEHLVVEFKRPSIALGQEELGQIKKYAFKVASDNRFNKEKVRWTFLLIGNRLDEFATHECTMPDREFGHIYTGKSVDIFVKEWATLLDDANWRYEFFRSQLEFQATKEETVGYIRQKHAQYFPATAVASNGNGSNGHGSPASTPAPTVRKPKGKAKIKRKAN